MVHTADQAAPADRWMVVTPNDTTNLPAGVRSIFVGGAGNVVAMDWGVGSSAITFTGVAAGTVLPIQAKRITTASTATLMVARF